MTTTRLESPDGKPVVEFKTRRSWRSWLEKNHDRSSGVWVRLGKKGSGIKSVTRDEALDMALCYGWIDGQSRSESDLTWLQKFTPRGTRSLWSKINRVKVEGLVASGDMQPAGAAEIERAKKDGRWEAAYDPPTTMAVPEDFQAALDKNRKARSFFEKLNSQNRYAILFRIQTAKRAETRARRIAEFIEMLMRGETVH